METEMKPNKIAVIPGDGMVKEAGNSDFYRSMGR
jgi:hypothetical protein